MNKLILLLVSAIALQAQTAVINGATARFRVITGTGAASSTACDASNEVGGLYVRTGNQSSVPTSVSVCKQTGASSYAWGPIGWYAQTAAPATCTVGELWFDTDATAGQNLNLCTSTNTFTAITGGAGNPAGSNKQIQYNSSGSFGAEAGFEYDPATNTMSVDKISLTGAASESTFTCISGDPSAPATDKMAIYCLTSNQRLKYYPEGGSATYVADGNSSGEALKGVAGAYDATTWNGSSETPTKDAIRDKIESMAAGSTRTDYFPVGFTNGSSTNATGGWYSSGTSCGVVTAPMHAGCGLGTGSKILMVLGTTLPADWGGTLSAKTFASLTGNVSGTGTYVLDIRTQCVTPGTSETLDGSSWNTKQGSGNISHGTYKSVTIGTFSSLTTTGCAAGDFLEIEVSRDTTSNAGDTTTESVLFMGLELTR